MNESPILYTALDLRFFDGAGAGAGASASNGADGSAAAPAAPGASTPTKPGRNPLADVRYGKQEQEQVPAPAQADHAELPEKPPENDITTDTEQARKAEFERLIKGDYKADFDARVQQIINARFKEQKALEAQATQAQALSPVLELLAGKYGVDAQDTEALAKAIQEDNSYYEDEAAQKGLTVEQLKHMKRIERENAEFKRSAQELERRQNADRVYAGWQEQSEGCKQIYPQFTLQGECAHPETGQRFLSLLKSGVDVRTAYEVIHKDELIGGAMQYTAQTVQQKTINDIRARGMRPAENGASGNAAAVVKSDPKAFTKRDRDEISRRVMRGERIEF